VFSMDRERISHALRGELMCGEDENGFLYRKATPEECSLCILNAYDNCAYRALELAAGGRAMERIMKEHGLICGETYTLQEYMEAKEEELQRYKDYQCEAEDGLSDGPIGFDETPEPTEESVMIPTSMPVTSATPNQSHPPPAIAPAMTNGGCIRSCDNFELAKLLAKLIANPGELDGESAVYDWLNQERPWLESMPLNTKNILRYNGYTENVTSITNLLNSEELLKQLAEECNELAQAALKRIRTLTNENPTPVTSTEADNRLHEEAADVLLCLETLGIHTGSDLIRATKERKAKRWAERLDGRTGGE
ncbi:MAG: hypothetical protein J6X53_03490, partial [Abditibacteriota bacterium]|nr:hypothetical protein [Abditibacteriota bacterium]